MNRGEWDAFIATLSKVWREFGQAMMRRVNHLLNEERSERLSDIQRLDRRIDRIEERKRGGGAGG
jgi:hypothetical protein